MTVKCFLKYIEGIDWVVAGGKVLSGARGGCISDMFVRGRNW